MCLREAAMKVSDLSGVWWRDPCERILGTTCMPPASSCLWCLRVCPRHERTRKVTAWGGNAKPWLDLPAKLLVICTLMEMKGAPFSYLNFFEWVCSDWTKWRRKVGYGQVGMLSCWADSEIWKSHPMTSQLEQCVWLQNNPHCFWAGNKKGCLHPQQWEVAQWHF